MRKIVHESSEDYLEAILMLSEEKPYVRSVDIANELGFKKSSVSIAMKHLRELLICNYFASGINADVSRIDVQFGHLPALISISV